MTTLGLLISWTVFGLIVGFIARALVPGRQSMGCGMTILLGVAGSMVGGAITWIWRGAEPDMYAPANWIMSIIGAMIVVLVYSRRQRQP